MNKNDQQFIAQKIRAQYIEKVPSQLDVLRELDKDVKRPAYIFGYVFGSIGAIIMGAGMSLVMTDISNALGMGSGMLAGIFVGVAGMLMTVANYPIYKNILESRKKKYGSEILRFSEEIINN